MSFFPIQPNIHCEPCKVCGARPIVEQFPKDKFAVRCPSNAVHYQIRKGMVKIDEWNMANKVVNYSNAEQQVEHSDFKLKMA